MRKFLLLTLISAALFGCGSKTLSIDIAIDNGFQKTKPKLFQAIGAKDGWSGTWAGDDVELYEYESSDAVRAELLEPAAAPGNSSGWVELCVKENLLMLSKGANACRSLESI